MYTRVPSGRIPRGMRVPENYSGNAFRSLPNDMSEAKPPRSAPRAPNTERVARPIPLEHEAEPTVPEPSAPETTEEAPVTMEETKKDESSSHEADTPVGGKPSSFELRSPFQGLFQGFGLHIGFEELLLLGLILLISQDGKNDDLVLLLLLLLFIQ